ncbi:MAG: DUF4176 domain-containing protein [Erysipelotrichaceae bacterium]|uniref:DUF4176 domain-containing protein n=1 Tax=Faecalicoccus TaxID=1573536 RepID=UPI0026EE6AFA|nr:MULTISPECIES: DUF4176 domain-containing protein [Faecalicoccus]MBE6120096.1 DUF4176 domain-containing protein [Erysipelotrichaceae bacterium]MDY5233189.1 DUF4176 domain-containing protein [Faecalicoccus sp.]
MKELLPIGTVVTLHQGTKKLMIIGRIQREKTTGKIYDYAACLWPEGSIDTQHFYLFNTEDVHILYHIGLQSVEEFRFRSILDEQIKKLEEDQ